MKAQSQPRHVAAAVSHPSKTTPGVSNGIQHFALIFKALSRFFLLLGHTGSMLFWTLLWIVILAISFCLEVLYLFIRSGIHSSSSLGSLLVSLRCHALRELLLTPHLKFSPFSVTICHDQLSSRNLFDFPSWVTYENVPNCFRVILYNFLFLPAYLSL